MTDNKIVPTHHNVPADDAGRHPSFTLFASPSDQLIFVMVDSGLSTSFHITRAQCAQLIAALQDADNELAAREVVGCPVCGSNDTEHTPGEGCSYQPEAVSA